MFKTTLSVLGVLLFLTPANAAGPEVAGRIETEMTPVSMAYDGKTGRLFLASDDGRIAVLDGKSGKVIKTVKPKAPVATYMGGNGISLTPSTEKLYMPADKKGVIVFDIKSNKAIKIVGEKKERDDYAMAVAVNQKDSSYVTVEWSGYVSIYDGAKDILKSEFPLDFKGRNYFALSPDGESIYVSVGGELLNVSLKDKRIKSRVDMDGATVPLVDQTGNVFLGGSGAVYRMDKDGGIVKTPLPTKASLGAGLAFNPKTGHLFVPMQNGTVSVLKVSGKRMDMVAEIEAGPSPKAAIVVDNTVYVARAGGITVIQDSGE